MGQVGEKLQALGREAARFQALPYVVFNFLRHG